MRKLLCQNVGRLMGSLGQMGFAPGHNVLYVLVIGQLYSLVYVYACNFVCDNNYL